MKVFWRRCTWHLFEPPWINDQGREVQTTFCDLLSRSSAWSQGGKQFSPRGPAHQGGKVVKGFGSEALCKESVWRLKEEGVVILIFYSDQYSCLLETKSSLVGRRDPKWILDRLLSLSVPHRGKWKSKEVSGHSPIAKIFSFWIYYNLNGQKWT